MDEDNHSDASKAAIEHGNTHIVLRFQSSPSIYKLNVWLWDMQILDIASPFNFQDGLISCSELMNEKTRAEGLNYALCISFFVKAPKVSKNVEYRWIP